MTHGAGSPLINMREPGRLTPADEARLVKWLASVRGPDSKDPPFVTLPRPQGRQTRVVITEYELRLPSFRPRQGDGERVFRHLDTAARKADGRRHHQIVIS